MDSKCAIFVAVGSLLVMAMYSPIINFVSAAKYQCYEFGVLGGSICIANDDPKDVQYCYKDKNGIGNCEKLNSKPTPPGIEQLLENTVKEETQTNTNDPKDLGGMQTDKGITKSPIE